VVSQVIQFLAHALIDLGKKLARLVGLFIGFRNPMPEPKLEAGAEMRRTLGTTDLAVLQTRRGFLEYNLFRGP
jgi:hypothetical protein